MALYVLRDAPSATQAEKQVFSLSGVLYCIDPGIFCPQRALVQRRGVKDKVSSCWRGCRHEDTSSFLLPPSSSTRCPMNPTTVAGYVDALISDFDSGLLSYARWKKRKESENHYCKQSASPGQAGVTYCALSTSLRVSGPKIQETYELGSAILGPNFSTGDALCLGLLSSQLLLIRSRTVLLRQALLHMASAPLDLSDILQCSETVRSTTIRALSEQYQRMAIGRPVPRELPVPRSLHSSRQDADTPALPDPEYFDGGDTAVWPTQSPMPQFLSEPPSPPLTPQLMNNGIESAYPAPYSKVGAVTCGDRPINGVFSVFCPEALALQVDIKRQVPARRKCQCGYLWGAPELSGGMDSLLLKDGFRMTRRFLAKSHCEPRGQRPYGMRYGCVLCTSTGWTETHETAEHLRVHINASHIKWQMLHDRDLTALQPIAA